MACNPGYQDCNGTVSDGCEVDTATSVANCGGCGATCPLEAHTATEQCVTSACAVAKCAAGYADCNHLNADGCEVDVLTCTRGRPRGTRPRGGYSNAGPLVRAVAGSYAILGGGFTGTIDFGTNPALTTTGTSDLFLAKVLP